MNLCKTKCKYKFYIAGNKTDFLFFAFVNPDSNVDLEHVKTFGSCLLLRICVQLSNIDLLQV